MRYVRSLRAGPTDASCSHTMLKIKRKSCSKVMGTRAKDFVIEKFLR